MCPNFYRHHTDLFTFYTTAISRSFFVKIVFLTLLLTTTTRNSNKAFTSFTLGLSTSSTVTTPTTTYSRNFHLSRRKPAVSRRKNYLNKNITTNNNTSNMSRTGRKHKTSIYWFRNALRMHDNPSLLKACTNSESMIPLYIIDPECPFSISPGIKAGTIRANFILESLAELNGKLEKKNSQLMCKVGKPEQVISNIITEAGSIDAIYYEKDPSFPVRETDKAVFETLPDNIEVLDFDTHSMLPMETYLSKTKDKKAPSTYGSFTKIFQKLKVPEVVDNITQVPPLPTAMIADQQEPSSNNNNNNNRIPSLEDLGYDLKDLEKRDRSGLDFKGGETAALILLKTKMRQTSWVCTFEKPKTSPNALKVDTTGLSPYVKHGCLSARTFYHALSKVYQDFNPSKLSKPPVSLHGQLMWREYNYLMGYTTPNFDKMEGNPIARQIPWTSEEELLLAWKEARTGYPYIDAIMTQLKETGWIHHLARHSVACFLTRGDLWQSWEKGTEHFESHLIDADWSINNFNWQWLSCTAHFYQYFRCYSPIAFGKKTDPNGDYIRKWLPQFKKFPTKYIYEPWTAPKHVQEKCGVVIGTDYPKPIVDHKIVSKENMNKMKIAYDEHKLKDASNNRGSGRKTKASSKATSEPAKKKRKGSSMLDFVVK